jgi:hypothetical protein
MQFQLSQTMSKIERLGKSERDYRRILEQLPDRDLAYLELLEDPDRMSEADVAHLDGVMSFIYEKLAASPMSARMR